MSTPYHLYPLIPTSRPNDTKMVSSAAAFVSIAPRPDSFLVAAQTCQVWTQSSFTAPTATTSTHPLQAVTVGWTAHSSAPPLPTCSSTPTANTRPYPLYPNAAPHPLPTLKHTSCRTQIRTEARNVLNIGSMSHEYMGSKSASDRGVAREWRGYVCDLRHIPTSLWLIQKADGSQKVTRARMIRTTLLIVGHGRGSMT